MGNVMVRYGRAAAELVDDRLPLTQQSPTVAK
jgi:hypothetical protein